MTKQCENRKKKVANKNRDDVEGKNKSPQPETEMDLKVENRAKSQLEKKLEFDAFNSQNYTQNY